MYRSDLNSRDKSGALAAVLAIHAGLAFALLHMSGTIDVTDPQRSLQIFDISEVVPPPPPPPPPPQQAERPKPKKEEGGSSPNIKSEATPIVAPSPRIPTQSPVAVSETPAEGAAPTQGLAPVRGPGTGSGGSGSGTGTGSGAGAGGGGGIAERARLLTPSLRSRDFPGAFRRLLASGRAPFVMFTVLPNGRVTNCRIYQSSGDPTLDNITCSLVTSRFVYRPAINRRGEPVESQMAYRQGQ